MMVPFGAVASVIPEVERFAPRERDLVFIARWLRSRTDPRVGLRPHRTVQLDLPLDVAFARAQDAIERVLGANVTICDVSGGLLEAGFGLVHSERIRASFERLTDDRTAIRVEAFYPAGTVVPKTSQAVDVLADALSSTAP